MVYGKEISFRTQGYSDVEDITGKVDGIVKESGIWQGMVCISVIGSTASVTTTEYEPALVEDIKDQLEEFASRHKVTRHSQTWGDDNGFSHLRAAFMGPSIILPVAEGSPILGTWQQIVVIDHDNQARMRRVFVQVLGE